MLSSIRIPFAAAIVAFLLVSTPSFAERGNHSRLPAPTDIEEVRTNAEVWDFVTIEGRVVRKTSGLFFQLEDDTGTMTVRIPNHVTRELGIPKLNERIRVAGKFDHKTLWTKGDHNAKPDSPYWGIRVARMDRNVSNDSDTRNPDAPTSEPIAPRPATPAAIGETSFEARPNAGKELVDRLAAGRKRVDSARNDLEDADAAYARALGRNESDPAKLETLQGQRRSAESDLQEAVDAIPPLVLEARDAGVAESVLDLYRQATAQ